VRRNRYNRGDNDINDHYVVTINNDGAIHLDAADHVDHSDVIVNFRGTEYKLVRRDHFDNLAAALIDYERRPDNDRRVYLDVAALNAAADLVYSEASGNAVIP